MDNFYFFRKATTTIRPGNLVVKGHIVQLHNQKQTHPEHYLPPQTRGKLVCLYVYSQL